jgi:hypothetical protein
LKGKFNKRRFIVGLWVSSASCFIAPPVIQAEDQPISVKISTQGNTPSESNQIALGQTLDVGLKLKKISEGLTYDIYLSVGLPNGQLMFLKSTTGKLFDESTFTVEETPYVKGILPTDKEGPTLKLDLSKNVELVGPHTLYAVMVPENADPSITTNWVGYEAKEVFVNRVSNN